MSDLEKIYLMVQDGGSFFGDRTPNKSSDKHEKNGVNTLNVQFLTPLALKTS